MKQGNGAACSHCGPERLHLVAVRANAPEIRYFVARLFPGEIAEGTIPGSVLPCLPVDGDDEGGLPVPDDVKAVKGGFPNNSRCQRSRPALAVRPCTDYRVCIGNCRGFGPGNMIAIPGDRVIRTGVQVDSSLTPRRS